jgi:hypothetical protein
LPGKQRDDGQVASSENEYSGWRAPSLGKPREKGNNLQAMQSKKMGDAQIAMLRAPAGYGQT